MESIPWVRCASGNVYLLFLYIGVQDLRPSNLIESNLMFCDTHPMTTSPLFVWGGKLSVQEQERDNATSFIREAPRHETSRPWWERLSDRG